ncbi:MAG: hypothetical protein QOD56_1074 [Gammaproteobacteria bacterium]|nr:hypothetical protein [Gammaproteobacteria bacterium]
MPALVLALMLMLMLMLMPALARLRTDACPQRGDVPATRPRCERLKPYNG